MNTDMRHEFEKSSRIRPPSLAPIRLFLIRVYLYPSTLGSVSGRQAEYVIRCATATQDGSMVEGI
jgi:hypothetical protein